MVGGSMVGVRFERSNQTVSVRYFHQDHLGSIAVLTDETGNVVERDSYDPWGKRRFTNGSDDPTDSIVSQTIRGYTGQEMLADVALVHLNGRVYDPLIARMLSADPMVPDPLNGQTRNRYSYVGNNPLAFTDPTGYCFLNLCGVLNDISRFINNGLRAAANFLRQNIGSIIEIAVTAICTASVVCAPLVPLVSLATSVAIAGVTSGSLTVALQTAAIQVFTMGMDFAIGSIGAGIPVLGELPAFLQPANLFKDIAHALVGCARFVMSGGSCRAGALSGAVPAIAGSLPLYGSLDWTGRLLFKSVLGGLGSVAGGGKFANGAVTGAFQYLYNDALHGDSRNYDPSDPNYHKFDFTESVCSFNEAGCTVARGMDALLLFAAPGQDVPAFTGHTLNALDPIWTGGSAGPIYQDVSPDGLSVTNATLQGHMFDQGYITRSLVITDQGIFINTVGEGTGPDPTFNGIMGPAAFQWLNREMRAYMVGGAGPRLFNGW
jgi:RHS repeat-associated protein